jgi:hypothetical protein
MTTRRQQTRNSRTRQLDACYLTLERTTDTVLSSSRDPGTNLITTVTIRNEASATSSSQWLGQESDRGVVTRMTPCYIDVRWPGNVVSNKPKEFCLIVTEEVRESRDQLALSATHSSVETFAMEAFPVLAQLMVRGAIMSGVTSEEFDNNSVERGVMDQNHRVRDSEYIHE